MKIKDIIHSLINAENYATVRSTVSDEVIDFIKVHMTSQYNLFKEKEEAYQDILKLLKHEKSI